jgi:hypothetical protein
VCVYTHKDKRKKPQTRSKGQKSQKKDVVHGVCVFMCVCVYVCTQVLNLKHIFDIDNKLTPTTLNWSFSLSSPTPERKTIPSRLPFLSSQSVCSALGKRLSKRTSHMLLFALTPLSLSPTTTHHTYHQSLQPHNEITRFSHIKTENALGLA